MEVSGKSTNMPMKPIKQHNEGHCKENILKQTINSNSAQTLEDDPDHSDIAEAPT